MAGASGDIGVLELVTAGDGPEAQAQRVELREAVGIGTQDQVLGGDRLLHLIGFYQRQLDALRACLLRRIEDPSAPAGEPIETLFQLLAEDLRDLAAAAVELAHRVEEAALDGIALGALGKFEQRRSRVLEQLRELGVAVGEYLVATLLDDGAMATSSGRTADLRVGHGGVASLGLVLSRVGEAPARCRPPFQSSPMTRSSRGVDRSFSASAICLAKISRYSTPGSASWRRARTSARAA